MRKRAWIVGLGVVAFLVAAGFAFRSSTRPRPLFTFLAGGKLAADTVYITGDGKPRRIQMYRFSQPYVELQGAAEEEVKAHRGWSMKQKGTSPFSWIEYQNSECSVEVVDGHPTSFSVNPNGVSWDPPPEKGEGRTVFVTRPVAWSEDITGWLGRLYRDILRL